MRVNLFQSYVPSSPRKSDWVAGNSIWLAPVRGRWAGGSAEAASLMGRLLELESEASSDRTALQNASAEVVYPALYHAL